MFEYYVLNYDCNADKVEMYNIFNNSRVSEWCEQAVKKYLRAPAKYEYKGWKEDPIYGFDALCKEFKSAFMNQLWSRREYEISVSDAFVPDVFDISKLANECETLDEFKAALEKEKTKRNRLEKIDCFKQVEPNIPMIVRDCIRQYKEAKENG